MWRLARICPRIICPGASPPPLPTLTLMLAEVESMRVKRVFFFVLFQFLILSRALAQTGSPDCLNLLTPLVKKRDAVASLGGIWGLFEQNFSLSTNSSMALQLDSNINKIIVSLKYLCDTQNGVPLNELARYVSKGLSELGEAGFRQEHIKYGKTPVEIDRWLKYTKLALSNRNRKLDGGEIEKSIHGAEAYLKKYWGLAQELESHRTVNPLESEIDRMNRDIDRFLSTNAYVSQSIFERSQIPYWDIDENHGGS